MNQPEERDLAHESDMRELMRQQLRDNISPEEAAEECAKIDDRNGAHLDDHDELLGDPDEYDEHYCICQVEHTVQELDSEQCDACGRPIV